MKKPTISLKLDRRSTMQDGTIPIKIYLYYSGRQWILAPSKPLSASEEDYEIITVNKNKVKLTGKHRKLKEELKEEERKANDIIDELNIFTIEAFKKGLKGDDSKTAGSRETTSLKQLFDAKQAELKKHGQLSNEYAYKCSYSNLDKFAQKHLRLNTGNCCLEHITLDFLMSYRSWNLKQGNSLATVGSYLRCLRHIFNIAISDKLINPALYPFGRKKDSYSVGGNVASKKYLTEDDLHTLYFSDKYLAHPAKLYWFWCYYTGMNPIDVIHLRMEDVYSPDGINVYARFFRQKTKFSPKDAKPITIHLKPDMLNIIQQLRPANSKAKYVFPVLEERMDEVEARDKLKSWSRSINRSLHKISKALGLQLNLNLAIGRSTFATSLNRLGVPISQISFMMGHGSVKTTEIYLGAMSEMEIASVADNLDNFKKGKDMTIILKDTKMLGRLISKVG